jgi:hypothetical protein
MIVLIYKWREKTAFSDLLLVARDLLLQLQHLLLSGSKRREEKRRQDKTRSAS